MIAPVINDKKIFIENFSFFKHVKFVTIPAGMSMNVLMIVSESGRWLKFVEMCFSFIFLNFKEIEIDDFEILIFESVPIVIRMQKIRE